MILFTFVVQIFAAANIIVSFVPTRKTNDFAYSSSIFHQSFPLEVKNHIHSSNISKQYLRHVRTDAFSVPFGPAKTKDGTSRVNKPRPVDKGNNPTNGMCRAPKEYASTTKNNFIGRRKWIIDGIITSASSIGTIHAQALQTSEGLFPPQRSSALCDQTIECYRKGNKKIFIVGTAHVSSISAQLSGDVVKEVKVGLNGISYDLLILF